MNLDNGCPVYSTWHTLFTLHLMANIHYSLKTWIVMTYLKTWKTMDWKQNHFELYAVMIVGACKANVQQLCYLGCHLDSLILKHPLIPSVTVSSHPRS
jgi:hypothetical protein